MSEVDAVSLLRKVSGYEGDNAIQVIKSPHVGRLPLGVARWAKHSLNIQMYERKKN